jgi:hypothetical protein
MTARNTRLEMADLLFIAWGGGHDALTLSSWIGFVKGAWRCIAHHAKTASLNRGSESTANFDGRDRQPWHGDHYRSVRYSSGG